MSVKRPTWNELEPHLDRALELDGLERAEYLSSLPGNLAGEVERLLADESPKDRLLDRSIADVISGVVDRLGGTEEGLVIGGYSVVRRLGSGGMGQVLLGEAEHLTPPRVAIKMVRWELVDEAARARFDREREALERVRHPGVAALLGGGVADDGRPFLLLEFIEGRPLLAFCDEALLSVESRVRLFLELVRTVAAIHQQGVVHRDLKPENVLVESGTGADEVESTPRVRLLDFGIAKLVEVGGREQQSPLAALTPRYAAPEQLIGGEISAATDLFSLGATLHELLVGSAPRPRPNRTSSSLESVVGDWLRPSEVPLRDEKDNPGLARRKAELRGFRDPRSLSRELRGDLDRAMLSCLAPNPRDRIASASVLVAALEDWLDRPRARSWGPWRRR